MYVPGGKLGPPQERNAWIILPKSFVKLGYQSTLVCGKVEGVSTDGLSVIETGLPVENPWVPTYGLIRSLFEPLLAFPVIMRSRPNLVIVGPTRSSLITLLPIVYLYRKVLRNRRVRSVRFLLKSDSDMDFSIYNRYVAFFANLAVVAATRILDLVAVESSGAMERARRLPFIRADKVVRIPIGRTEHFKTQLYEDSVRKPIILCVARITRVKAQNVLLRAFSTLAKRYPEWSVRFVGSVMDKKMAEELEQLTIRHSLQGRVSYSDFVKGEDLRQEYSRAAVFCLPSLRESGGSVRYEATECGLPVVTTDTPCRKDNEENGWIVARKGDPVDLATKLEELLSSEERRRQQSRISQARLQSYMDVAKMYEDALNPTHEMTLSRT
jgi:glycosyltransferase involved in cell wall biosynthesis